MRRVNFAAGLMGDTSLPGVQAIVNNLRERGTMTPAQLVEACLELSGPVEVSESTYSELLEQARQGGDLSWDSDDAERRAGLMLALIAASRDFQFA